MDSARPDLMNSLCAYIAKNTTQKNNSGFVILIQIICKEDQARVRHQLELCIQLLPKNHKTILDL